MNKVEERLNQNRKDEKRERERETSMKKWEGVGMMCKVRDS